MPHVAIAWLRILACRPTEPLLAVVSSAANFSVLSDRGLGAGQSVCSAHDHERQANGMPIFRLPNETKVLNSLPKKLVE